MQLSYNLDSDSDDDDEVNSNTKSKRTNGALNQIHDIEKLKTQTAELLDPSWKESRNKRLIQKMLDLEEPSITPKVLIHTQTLIIDIR
jgi:hypothetical protein